MAKDSRVNDMIDVLKLNDAILDMYDKLAELEKDGLENTQEYETLCDLIKYSKKGVRRRLYSYPLDDDYMDKFLSTMDCFDKTDTNYFDYTTYLTTTRHRRLFEFMDELSLLYHFKPKEVEIQGKFVVDGVEYDLMDDLEELVDDGYSEEDLEELKSLMNNNQEYSKDVDDYYYAAEELEANIFMKYLLEAIANEKNVRVKDKLIDVKYHILSTISFLEDRFLFDHSITTSIEHLHQKLKYILTSNKSFYAEYLQEHLNIIEYTQNELMERNKVKYNNTNEKVIDILEELSVKTHISCIPDKDIREEIFEDQKAAVELSESKIDKKVLKRAIELNNNYVINNNYN